MSSQQQQTPGGSGQQPQPVVTTSTPTAGTTSVGVRTRAQAAAAAAALAGGFTLLPTGASTTPIPAAAPSGAQSRRTLRATRRSQPMQGVTITPTSIPTKRSMEHDNGGDGKKKVCTRQSDTSKKRPKSRTRTALTDDNRQKVKAKQVRDWYSEYVRRKAAEAAEERKRRELRNQQAAQRVTRYRGASDDTEVKVYTPRSLYTQTFEKLVKCKIVNLGAAHSQQYARSLESQSGPTQDQSPGQQTAAGSGDAGPEVLDINAPNLRLDTLRRSTIRRRRGQINVTETVQEPPPIDEMFKQVVKFMGKRDQSGLLTATQQLAEHVEQEAQRKRMKVKPPPGTTRKSALKTRTSKRAEKKAKKQQQRKEPRSDEYRDPNDPGSSSSDKSTSSSSSSGSSYYSAVEELDDVGDLDDDVGGLALEPNFGTEPSGEEAMAVADDQYQQLIAAADAAAHKQTGAVQDGSHQQGGAQSCAAVGGFQGDEPVAGPSAVAGPSQQHGEGEQVSGPRATRAERRRRREQQRLRQQQQRARMRQRREQLERMQQPASVDQAQQPGDGQQRASNPQQATQAVEVDIEVEFDPFADEDDDL